jgi:hypothetical protein
MCHMRKTAEQGDGVGKSLPSGRKLALLEFGDQQVRHPASRPPRLIVYSLVSGALATTAGAAMSLAFSGGARLAVWCVVAGGSSVAAGLVRESSPVSSCWSACCRWLSRLASLSASS